MTVELLSFQKNLQLGTSHKISWITTAISQQKVYINAERRCWAGDKRPPLAFRIIFPAVNPAGNNSMCAYVSAPTWCASFGGVVLY